MDIPEDRIDFLKSLKENYNLFLLINTNSIHQLKYLNDFEDKYKYSFNSLFQKVYYSHEIGIRKPDEKVFQFILEDNILIPEETLFVDDSLENINSADKSDINTFHIKNYNLKSIL